jgi:hypothetical protein
VASTRGPRITQLGLKLNSYLLLRPLQITNGSFSTPKTLDWADSADCGTWDVRGSIIKVELRSFKPADIPLQTAYSFQSQLGWVLLLRPAFSH